VKWLYEDNPDTASYVGGMTVRTVIGVPWSAENAAWFAAVGSGTVFRVQMNTGALLTFRFEGKRTILTDRPTTPARGGASFHPPTAPKNFALLRAITALG
jgi:hypothetical protein